MNSDDIIILLGAGASHDAGLKISDEMTDELEKLLETRWCKFQKLYNAVKAGILYGHALKGDIRDRVNIEEFVNVLTELSSCEEHTIFPFIASWNMVLMDTAGPGFENVKQFRGDIIKELVTQWVKLEDSENAQYFRKLNGFVDELGSNLRVFSLNYDTCLEQGCGPENVMTGFIKEGERKGKVWNDRVMTQNDAIRQPIRLYKLHGSINWRDEDGVLVSHDSPTACNDANDYQLIFGTKNKMRYTEPYLYLLSAFRDASSNAKLIVCIGYSFQDDHVNSIINHAFKSKAPTHLLHVCYDKYPNDENKRTAERERVAKAINVSPDEVTVCLEGAKSFLENRLHVAYMEEMIERGADLF